MKFHIFAFISVLMTFATSAAAQVDSVVGQVTNSLVSEAFAGGISGDGRFIVFESAGNVATENPRNADGNREIFLFDYAQRRIFQITDTKSLLIDTTRNPTFDNIKVDIVNTRPVISVDGRWIAFGSNATTSTPTAPDATNPGSFDANSFTTTGGSNPLTADGNTEIWLYQVPVVPAADLSSGIEIPFANLEGGSFTRATNSLPSRLPTPGSTTAQPFIADDNRDISINDDGSYLAFASSRDLVTGGNASPADNDEIFVFVRGTATLKQITQTPRGTIGNPIYNGFPSISGNGLRVAFMSNANNAIVGMTGGSNADNNEEIFMADLDATGAPSGTKRQVTTTARVNPGDLVNTFNAGKRLSRDGRFLTFDSFADLANEHSGSNQAGFATFVYDFNPTPPTPNPLVKRVCARSDADSGASGGDVQRYPTFTDYDVNGTPATLVMETRMNIKPDGTIPTTASDGLNNIAARPVQIYSYPLNLAPAATVFTRLSRFPAPDFFLSTTAPLTSNSVRRMAFNLSSSELGAGNEDLGSEVFYLYLPPVNRVSSTTMSYSTGASRIPVSASPVPTPTATPTPTPTATPTPTPTPTPTVSPTPTPTPTPQSPPAVQGVSPGMLVLLDYDSGLSQPVAVQTANGSISRRFSLPIELSGVTLTVNGVAAGLKSVGRRQIEFVVPPGLLASSGGIKYPVVINNNGTVFKGEIVVVPARPDLFTNPFLRAPGGRVNALNVVNRVFTLEPFTVTTFKLRGSRRVPTVLRIFLTGVNDISATRVTGAAVIVRIGDVTIAGSTAITNPVLVEPGVYSMDVTLPAALAGAGDRPIVVTVNFDGVPYTSRLDDTSSRIRIL